MLNHLTNIAITTSCAAARGLTPSRNQGTVRVSRTSLNGLARCSADDAGLGRVEDGRGSLGPVASTPFPIPAHRTGDPDFRSPALRLVSPQGTRRGNEWQAFEAQQTEFPVDDFTREPHGTAPCHFMPSCEEIAHTLVGVAINRAEYRSARPVAEIVRPATQ